MIPPALLLRGAAGLDRVPGLPGEQIFASLYSAGQVSRWLQGLAPWGSADVAAGVDVFWPAQPLPTFLQALLGLGVGAGVALWLILFVGIWLAGHGTWVLASRLLPAAGWKGGLAALLAGLAVELSPPVLRSAWSGDTGILSVGFVALALASRRGVTIGLWGLLAGAWAPAAGLAVACWALFRLRPAGALAVIPLLLALFYPPSHLPGAAREQITVGSGVPAYVGAASAVLPLAPPDAPPHFVEPAEGALVLVARLHGGPLVLLGLIIGLAMSPTRRLALSGLGILGFITLALGWMPPPGHPPGQVAPWLLSLASLVPGFERGLAAWLALPVLASGLGLGALVARSWLAAPPLLASMWIASPLALKPILPVTNLPVEPAVEALAALPPGGVIHLPDAAAPFFQGPGALSELLHMATRHGRPISVGAASPPDPSLLDLFSRLADAPVDQGAAGIIWESRHIPPGEAGARGHVAVILDRSALGSVVAGHVDRCVHAILGPPLAESARWRVHALAPDSGHPHDPVGRPVACREPGAGESPERLPLSVP